MVKREIRFLADESCDFAIVRALKSAGYDVAAVSELLPSAPDREVLRFAFAQDRILITEDSDFGEWVFAHKQSMKGVLFIRFPGNARSRLGETVLSLIEDHSRDIVGNFIVLEPGRARIRRHV